MKLIPFSNHVAPKAGADSFVVPTHTLFRRLDGCDAVRSGEPIDVPSGQRRSGPIGAFEELQDRRARIVCGPCIVVAVDRQMSVASLEPLCFMWLEGSCGESRCSGEV